MNAVSFHIKSFLLPSKASCAVSNDEAKVYVPKEGLRFVVFLKEIHEDCFIYL